MADPAREDPPPCFGGPLWDPKAKECAGGMDPAFTDEAGGHVRAKCMFFDACGTKVQASKMEAARNLLDPRSLVKKDIPVLGPARPLVQAAQQPPQQTPGFVERFATALVQQQLQPLAQPVQQAPGRPLVYPQMPQGLPQQYGYQAMMPVNYQMPGYLTVPEQRYEGQSFWQFLGRTVLRSIGKSVGHSIAHLFDTVQLGPPTPPS